MSVNDFDKKGFIVINNYLSKKESEHLLVLIRKYMKKNKIPKVYRKFKDRSLNYFVIDGKKIENNLPKIYNLYTSVNRFVNKSARYDYSLLENKQAGVNVNITPKGGEYRWHYDRNAVTAILYLNKVKGGETEMYPNYRIIIKNRKYTRIQHWLDIVLQAKLVRILFGKKVVIKPRQGTMVIMLGNKCLHSVRKVESKGKRINIILSYDIAGAIFPAEKNLDQYLYSKNKVDSNDPNYS